MRQCCRVTPTLCHLSALTGHSQTHWISDPTPPPAMCSCAPLLVGRRHGDPGEVLWREQMPGDRVSALHGHGHSRLWFAETRGEAMLATHTHPPPLVLGLPLCASSSALQPEGMHSGACQGSVHVYVAPGHPLEEGDCECSLNLVSEDFRREGKCA